MNKISNTIKAQPKSNLILIVLSFALCIILPIHTNAQKRNVDTYPIPRFSSNTQFYLQRTTDANTVVYDLNVVNGILNDKEPIKPYWIRYTEKGAIKSLTSIQNKYAFGVKSTKVNAKHYQLQFAGYDKIPLHLKQLANGSFQTRVKIDDQELVLQRLYIHLESGGTFWSPNVAYIEFMGKDVASGKSIQKRIKP